MNNSTNHIEQEIARAWSILETVVDPEIPVVSVVDLGIVRSIKIETPEQEISITITPTYSGCPAMDVIATSIRLAMFSHGYRDVQIKQELSPAWTTDWITDKGKSKMKAFGVAPPQRSYASAGTLFAAPEKVQCPLCDSTDTRLLSEFGSTSCKALYQCNSCLEPFDLFKCH
jgi:ring-1,2-phenylacetyl-CoA epoxidase subunit PaaD